MQPEFSIDGATFKLFDKFTITIPIKDWQYLCKYRWLTKNPSQEDVDVEFGVYGARTAKNNIDANHIVALAIEDIKRLNNLDVCGLCEDYINSGKHRSATTATNGNIVITEKSANDKNQ